ncbi:Uncharacterised protein [uncultured archaeon]|nr:Uncharacterised protein [uncultured archaeon]
MERIYGVENDFNHTSYNCVDKSRVSFLENDYRKDLFDDLFEKAGKEIDFDSRDSIIELLESFGKSIRDNYHRDIPISKLEEKSSGRNKSSKSRDAKVHYVDSSSLPHGYGWKALGLYDPSTHTIYIADNLSPEVEKFVYWHEIAHSMGIYNEKRADDFAASKTGYRLSGRDYSMAA